MADSERRGWLSRLLGGDKGAAEAPEQPLAPPPTPGVKALDLLFGQPGEPRRGDSDGATDPLPSEPLAAKPAAPPTRTTQPDPTPPPPASGLHAQPTAPASAGAWSPPPAGAAAMAASVRLRIVAHVSNRGDMQAGLDAWAGDRGSGEQVEGLALTALEGIDPDDLEYLALRDDGTLTEWHRDEAYCGSRGEGRPLHGYALRLVGPAAGRVRLSYAAVFADGSQVGPVADGELCAAASRAPLQAIYVMVDPVV